MTGHFDKDWEVQYDHIHRCWHVVVDAAYVERTGRRVDSVTGTAFASGMAQHVANKLAEPGPALRDIRARVKRNNRRRFGP